MSKGAMAPEPRLTLAEIGPREFVVIEAGACYGLRAPGANVEFELDRLVWHKQELSGELLVRCNLAGTDAVEGVLSLSMFNVSSSRARSERATQLARQSRAPEVPWNPLLEELCQRVLAAERSGAPSADLRDLPLPSGGGDFEIGGLHLLQKHPTIVFGDGGALKSYVALYAGGTLAQADVRVGLFDWELSGEDHRDRLGRLFGDAMPAIRYVRCERPLVQEIDRLRRIVRADALDYVILDSIAFACDGPPEDAVVAASYFRALRQLGPIGSLHIAHISKAEGADQKPFGSAFWHNGARGTWFAKRSEQAGDRRVVDVALFNRKANLGPLRPAAGFRFAFEEGRTLVAPTNVADMSDLAPRLPVAQRIAHVLRSKGALTIAEIVEALRADTGETIREDSIRKAVTRGSGRLFTLVTGGNGVSQVGLLDRRSA